MIVPDGDQFWADPVILAFHWGPARSERACLRLILQLALLRTAYRRSKIPDVTIIGLNLAKSVFQVKGIDRMGDVVPRKMLRRARVSSGFKDALSFCDCA